ncbi:glycosyltransferase domain-containing protein [Plantactinospora sp. B6F1]|uniref:glycosyltransferase domain-containing protein n=1 Tax=Plantactinospora sp. B6F1 TaxID=3158971 RepID=UPI0032D97810
MKVVTVATELENPFLNRLLIPSCRASGLELTILQPQIARPFRFADKRACLTRYLSEVADRDELIVFTDAYDTLFIRDERYIQQTYAGFSQPVVFSAELNCWPLGVVGLALCPGTPVGRYPYLNSGGIVGPAGELLDLCTKYPEPPSNRFDLLERLRAHGYHTDQLFGSSDQYYWTLVQHLEPDRIGLDNDALIFEYLGPSTPGLSKAEIMREVQEFREQGRSAASYRRDHARLKAQLTTPSSAAQLHFASKTTKAALLDLWEEGEVPDWLRERTEPASAAGPDFRVCRV